MYWYFRESGGVNMAEGGEGGVGDLHLSGMREQMADLVEELRLAGYRLNAAETGSQPRTIENDIEALELKVNRLKLKQADYLSHRQ